MDHLGSTQVWHALTRDHTVLSVAFTGLYTSGIEPQLNKLDKLGIY